MLIAIATYVKKDFSEISSSVKVMGLMVANKYIGIGLIDPFYALFLGSLTNNYTAIGGMVSLMGLVSLFAVIPFARVADHVRTKFVVWHGLQLYCVVALLYFFAGVYHQIPLLILALILHGFAVVMVDTGAEVFIRRHAPFHKTAEAFGYLESVKNFGWVLGILLGGFLFPYYGFKGMFLAMVPCMLINSFLVKWVNDEGITSLLASLRRYSSHLRDFFGLFQDFHHLGRRIYFLYFITFFDGLVGVLTYTFIPLFARSLDLSYAGIALLMAVMYAPCIFSFLFAELADRLNKAGLIMVGLAIAVFTFVALFLVVSRFWVVLFSGLISVSMAIVRPAYNGLLSDFSPPKILGEVGSIQNFISRFAVMICPLFFGYIADVLSIRFVFLFTAGIAFALILLSLGMRGYFYITDNA
ncbi:MFS transporter [Candidatus Peregrinibacteria bacterium]|nr:MFS transporter [Candidatus Peregrinibacteria bacterium]